MYKGTCSFAINTLNIDNNSPFIFINTGQGPEW